MVRHFFVRAKRPGLDSVTPLPFAVPGHGYPTKPGESIRDADILRSVINIRNSGASAIRKIARGNLRLYFLAGVLVLIATGCGGGAPDVGDAPESTGVAQSPTATATATATPVPTSFAQTSEIRSRNPAPTVEPTEAFTVEAMELEPATGTAFGKLLELLPDNQATREYPRLGDFGGFADALGIDRLPPGSSRDERDEYIEYIAKIDIYALFGLVPGWPAEQRDYQSLIDTYPDLAFDYLSVDQFARSGDHFFNRASRPY
jgi:hypothetical protein